MVFPLGRPYVVPSDKLGHEVARLLIEPSATRDRLTARHVFAGGRGRTRVGAIELALAATLAAEPVEARMRDAFKAGQFSAKPGDDRVAAAVAAASSAPTSSPCFVVPDELADRVIRVDDFAQDLGASELERAGSRRRAHLPRVARSRRMSRPSERTTEGTSGDGDAMNQSRSTSSTARARRSSRRATGPARSPRRISPSRRAARC